MTAPPPSTQLGVLTTRTSNTLQTFPVPAPGPGEVLIRNVAVAANPKDYKLPGAETDYAFIEGNDVAGIVVQVGEGVTEYKGGERIAAFTKMRMKDNKYGAYAQYSVAPVSTTFPIPESTSFEEASTLPLAVMTAALGLFVVLGLPEPPAPGAGTSFAESNGKGIVVYGASSSVGAYALQLAKRAGFFIVAIAGASCDYAKSLGADVVLDYRAYKGEGELESATVKALGGRQTAVAYDAITLNGTTLLLGRVLAQTAPGGRGSITYVLHSFEDHDKLPQGVDARLTYVATAYLADEVFAARFYRQISTYLTPSDSNPTPFQPNRVKLMPDGLASVADGIELLRNNKVHGEKLVYRISETPGLRPEDAQ